MSNVILNILSEFKGKAAFKQADTAVAKLQKSVRNLAGGLGVAYGTRAIAAFGKQAVKAFAEDEAAALRLSNAVDNLGISFANVEVADFISNLESAAGIADDVLRPAFQALLTTTGSLTQSQKLLNDAITISRGTGVELATVAQDLANGYVGITRGLRKYNSGLTQSELKTKSFSDILGILLKQSSGAANAYLSTTSFKFDVLTVAVDNARESIGKGLIDALARAGGGTEASDAVKTINNIAKAINGITLATGTAIGGLTSALSLLGKLPKNIFEGFAGKAGGINTRPAEKPKTEKLSKTAQQKALEKLEADAAKRAKALIAAQTKAAKALTAEQKKQALLKKASTVFDMEQANIIAGLKKNISEDERRRLELQLALLTGNTDEASRLTRELAIAQGLGVHLANYLATLPDAKNPFASWAAYLDAIQAKVNSISGQSSMYDITPATNVESNYGGAFTDAVRGIGQYAEPMKVKIELAPTDDLTSAIARSMQQASLSSGNQAYIDRRTGGFGP